MKILPGDFIHDTLTLNMLDCFNDCKISIHILNRMLDLACPLSMKLTLEQQYMLSVLHGQYHACWCSGDFRSQGINRHGIDPKSWNIPFAASEDLTLDQVITWCCQETTQIAKFMGPTWGPPGSWWAQMGPMLAQWTLLSAKPLYQLIHCDGTNYRTQFGCRSIKPEDIARPQRVNLLNGKHYKYSVGITHLIDCKKTNAGITVQLWSRSGTSWHP